MDNRAGTSIYLGIDPGASGGLAEVGVSSKRLYVKSTKMPDTEKDLWNWVEERGIGLLEMGDEVFAVIEKVHAMPGNGVSGMFKFGQNYGFLRACLIAASIPFEEVQPRAWQKALGIPPRDKDESGTVWKNRLKAKAQQLYPSVGVTLATADALLIATYCQRKQEGRL